MPGFNDGDETVWFEDDGARAAMRAGADINSSIDELVTDLQPRDETGPSSTTLDRVNARAGPMRSTSRPGASR